MLLYVFLLTTHWECSPCCAECVSDMVVCKRLQVESNFDLIWMRFGVVDIGSGELGYMLAYISLRCCKRSCEEVNAIRGDNIIYRSVPVEIHGEPFRVMVVSPSLVRRYFNIANGWTSDLWLGCRLCSLVFGTICVSGWCYFQLNVAFYQTIPNPY